MCKFTEPYTTNYNRLEHGKCQYHKAGECFEISEEHKDGHAKLTVRAVDECFHVKADKNKFSLLKNQRCADYIILIFDSGRIAWSLHIIEFTKSVGRTEWEGKIIHQFDGALLNARAIAGVMELPQFDSITAHCAYRFNKELASPATQKSMLGKRATNSWTAGSQITLPSFPEVLIHKKLIKLNEETGIGLPIELC